jgi:transcription initiation factor TFIIH subunit 3
MGVSSLDKSMDLVEMRDGIMLGVTELVNQCVENSSKEGYIDRGTAIAAATSLGLCLINRVMKSATAGSSLLEENSLFRRKEDEGILGMISAKLNKEGENATKFAAEQRLAQRRARGMLSPRMLIVQASEDCTLDYNAFMNCVFAAIKNDVVIDGCFLSSPNMPETSTFLEQATDRSGGVYSKPKGTAQIFGGLTEVLMTVFLPPLGIRNDLNLPKVTEVDFRARCFETGESLDMGYVCNLCLSIFKNEPSGEYCLTCGAKKHFQKWTRCRVEN